MAPMASSGSVSLPDLLHEVPRLWEVLDCTSHRALLGTSSELRKHACQRVTKMRLLDNTPPDINHLTSDRWAQLQELDLTNGCMDAWETAKLSCGAWPLLKSLTLARGQHLRSSCDENVFRQFKGKWPLLESLIVVFNKVDTAQVKALTEIDWPHLKTLSIEPDDGATQALMQGNWPQLRDLSLRNGRSNIWVFNDFQHLARCKWSTLERLRLVRFNMSPLTIGSIVEAHLPLLKELSLVNVMGHDAINIGWWFTMLAQGRWPLLATLELAYVDGGPGCVETLASANWPCLQTVILKIFDMTDADVPALVAAAWPSVKNLTMSGPFENTKVLILCMNKWPLLESLTVGASKEVFAHLLDSARSNSPMLKLHKYAMPHNYTMYHVMYL